jgi:C1A family cysteine protease
MTSRSRNSNRGRGVSRALALGTGWLPEQPDPRDFGHDHASVASLLERVGVGPWLRDGHGLPAGVDLRKWCSPVRFQGGYNDCTANAVAELVEFFVKKAHGRSVRASRLFLYKVSRNLLGVEGNVGVYLRQVMGALKLVGVPSERYWPYLQGGSLAAPTSKDPRLDVEPTALCYALAHNYKAVSYYRLDTKGWRKGAALLRLAKAHLAAQIPFVFGFPLFQSIHQSMTTGNVPFPSPGEKRLGNHAVLAVGYDDRIRIRNRKSKAAATVGALLIQNSWSRGWGEKGFGWIPYEFVRRGHARDFWALIRSDWVDSGQFQLRRTVS